jgi:hypothetical protein
MTFLKAGAKATKPHGLSLLIFLVMTLTGHVGLTARIIPFDMSSEDAIALAGAVEALGWDLESRKALPTIKQATELYQSRLRQLSSISPGQQGVNFSYARRWRMALDTIIRIYAVTADNPDSAAGPEQKVVPLREGDKSFQELPLEARLQQAMRNLNTALEESTASEAHALDLMSLLQESFSNLNRSVARLHRPAFYLLSSYAVELGWTPRLQEMLRHHKSADFGARLLVYNRAELTPDSEQFLLGTMQRLSHPQTTLLLASIFLDEGNFEEESLHSLQRLLQRADGQNRDKDHAAIVLLAFGWSRDLALRQIQEAMDSPSTRRVYELMLSFDNATARPAQFIRELRRREKNPATLRRWQQHNELLTLVHFLLKETLEVRDNPDDEPATCVDTFQHAQPQN